MAGGGIVFVLEALQNTIYRTTDMLRIADSHLIVTIPYISTEAEIQHRRDQNRDGDCNHGTGSVCRGGRRAVRPAAIRFVIQSESITFWEFKRRSISDVDLTFLVDKWNTLDRP